MLWYRSFCTHLEICGRGCKPESLEQIGLTDMFCLTFTVLVKHKIWISISFTATTGWDWVASTPLLTGNVVSSLLQFPLLPIVYLIIRPDVGHHMLCLCFCYFMMFLRLQWVFHDDWLNLKGIKMLKNLPCHLVTWLSS